MVVWRAFVQLPSGAAELGAPSLASKALRIPSAEAAEFYMQTQTYPNPKHADVVLSVVHNDLSLLNTLTPGREQCPGRESRRRFSLRSTANTSDTLRSRRGRDLRGIKGDDNGAGNERKGSAKKNVDMGKGAWRQADDLGSSGHCLPFQNSLFTNISFL